VTATALTLPTTQEAARLLLFPNYPETKAMVAEALRQAQAVPVLDTPGAVLEAQQLLADIKGFSAEIDGRHAEAKAPFLAACQALDAVRRDLANPLVDATVAVRGRLTAYAAEQERIKREAEAAAAAQLAAEQAAAITSQEVDGTQVVDTGYLTPPLAPIAAALATPAVKVATRGSTEYHIDDHTQIPVEFLKLDTVAVRKYHKSTGKLPPGVRAETVRNAV
jgi:hypothetical protein